MGASQTESARAADSPSSRDSESPDASIRESAAAQMFPAARLLDKQKEMFEVQAELDEQKLLHERQEEAFKARETVLKKKDLELQESLVRFSRFLQENDTKCVRANRKAADERRLCEEKALECQALEQNVAGLNAQKEQALALLAKYVKYQDYLESVLEVTDMFHQIDDLLARHSTLEAANMDLRQQQWRAADLTEKTGADMQAAVKATTDEVLHLNSTISELKKQLEGARRDSHSTASRQSAAQTAAADQLRQLGQVKLATDNLYQRCKLRLGAVHTVDPETPVQLSFIGNYISDLAFILKESKVPGSRLAVKAA